MRSRSFKSPKSEGMIAAARALRDAADASDDAEGGRIMSINGEDVSALSMEEAEQRLAAATAARQGGKPVEVRRAPPKNPGAEDPHDASGAGANDSDDGANLDDGVDGQEGAEGPGFGPSANRPDLVVRPVKHPPLVLATHPHYLSTHLHATHPHLCS